jgi:hypothetical protein
MTNRGNLLHNPGLFFVLLGALSVVKPEGKRPLGRSRYRWEENVRMGLRERG